MISNMYFAATLFGVLLFAAVQSINSFPNYNPSGEQNENLFEGDLKLTEEQRLALDTRKLSLNAVLWIAEKKAVPYTIRLLPEATVEAIKQGIAHWEENTCIRFEERTSVLPTFDYVIDFIVDSGCYSFVGKVQRGGQPVSIGLGCETMGVVAHEIGHALGFLHEQSRTDRDNYIKILFDNIIEGARSNFQKSNSDDQVPYDYYSLMHYGLRDFSSNGRPVMEVINTDVVDHALLGNRLAMTFYDIKLANVIYGCTDDWLSSCNMTSNPCLNEGYIGENCECTCRPGTKGDNCQTVEKDYYDAIDDMDDEVNRQTVTENKTITSPGYPNSFRARQAILISPPNCTEAVLTFSEFEMINRPATGNCRSDVLEIRSNGPLSNGEMFCGTEIAKDSTFRSAGREMFLLGTLRTNSYPGWSAEVTFEPLENCEIGELTTATPTNEVTLTNNFVVGSSACKFEKEGDFYFIRNINYPDNNTGSFLCYSRTDSDSGVAKFTTSLESATNGMSIYLKRSFFGIERFSGPNDTKTSESSRLKMVIFGSSEPNNFNIQVKATK